MYYAVCHCSQYSTTGVTMDEVCTVLFVIVASTLQLV